MLKIFIFLILSVLWDAAQAVQDMHSLGLPTDAELNEEYFSDGYTRHGDLLMYNGADSTRASYDYYDSWPNGMIPYVISENVTGTLRALIPQAVDYLNKYTCLKIRPYKKSDKYYIRFLMDPYLIEHPESQIACSAMMGYMRMADQPVYIGKKCTKMPLVHELLHTLGFSHEHSRDDRDDYIQVYKDNIEDWNDYEKDYDHCIRKDQGKYPQDCKTNYYGVKYNYDSIMHYCDSCGSKRGKKAYKTLNKSDALGKPANTGQLFGLSEGDWLLVNRKYGCDPLSNPQIPKPDPIPDNPPKNDENKVTGCKKKARK